MPATSVAPRSNKHNMYPNNKVMPMSEWQRGYDARKSRKPITVCVSDEMTQGWCAADDAIGADAYIRAMRAEGMPFSAVCAVMMEA